MIYVGIDIGGTNIKTGIFDSDFNIISKTSCPFPKGQTSERICEIIREETMKLMRESGKDYDEIAAAGAAVPGSIDSAGEVVINAHNLGFNNTPLKKQLSDCFTGKTIVLENDADAAAFAELKAGALKGVKTGVFLTIGTGIGGSLIIGGEIFRGGRGNGAEPGHIIIDYYGEKCTCGNVGCAESVCSATWLKKQGMKLVKSGSDSLVYVKSGGDPEKVSAKTVIDSVKSGDTSAIRIFNEYLEYLASAAASIANLIDPEIIVIGGGISSAGDILYIPLRIKVNEKTFFDEEYTILPALMGNDAGMTGAAMKAAEITGDRYEIQK